MKKQPTHWGKTLQNSRSGVHNMEVRATSDLLIVPKKICENIRYKDRHIHNANRCSILADREYEIVVHDGHRALLPGLSTRETPDVAMTIHTACTKETRK